MENLKTMKNKIAQNIFLLAPVPLKHLLSGAITCDKTGKVAFGSTLWEEFRELDKLRCGESVEVLIYESEAKTEAKAKWSALYTGHVESVNGAHPEGMKYRPESTEDYESDNKGHWAIFWEVQNLKPLAPTDHVALSNLRNFSTKKPCPKIPRSPQIVEKT